MNLKICLFSFIKLVKKKEPKTLSKALSSLFSLFLFEQVSRNTCLMYSLYSFNIASRLSIFQQNQSLVTDVTRVKNHLTRIQDRNARRSGYSPRCWTCVIKPSRSPLIHNRAIRRPIFQENITELLPLITIYHRSLFQSCERGKK